MNSTSHLSIHSIQNGISETVSKYGNLFLVAGVGCVLAMMMIPLPSLLLDFLLAVNIMAALSLLLVAISVSNSLQLATFPTILLIATLFRLGLNISSTRLILTQAYAGQVIETFGNFATGGNLVVGLIMFLILTIIQFIVIAKGSERVAEVGARFTLDALPGKQMSIDADLRAGLLSQEEAKAQREDLQRESRMYGAMDGAMKFVKGDAIAGIFITIINILGGLYSGISLRGLGLTDAVKNYSTLAVGDGLVSQIPALLISITAGLIVTRVSDERNENGLGMDIGIQILAHPKALLMASGLAFLIGLIPGFPFVLFFMISLFLAGTSLYLMHRLKMAVEEPTPVEDYVMDTERQMIEHLGQAIPLVLELGSELYQVFQKDPRWTHCFGKLYPKLKMHLTHQVGVLFPEMKLALSPELKNTFRYRIRIWDVPVDFGEVTPKHCSLLDHPGRNKMESLEAPAKTTETAHGTPIKLYQLHQKPFLEQKGASPYGPEEMLLRHLARILKKHAGDFIGIQEVHNMLNLLEMKYPELVREVIPKMMSIQKLTEIVKRLVEEHVPIKDFRLILQTLSACQPEDKDPVTLTEQVRVGLKRTITFLYAEEGPRLNVFTIESEIEEEIRNSIQRNGNECFLMLSPHRLQTLAKTFRHCVEMYQYGGKRSIILTQLELRRYVRKIVENELPNKPVLSFQEIDPKAVLNPLGTIHHPLEGETVVVSSCHRKDKRIPTRSSNPTVRESDGWWAAAKKRP